MEYSHLTHDKHHIALTGQDIALLRDRLVPISPMDYNLAEFSILRHLYGRFDHIVFEDEQRHPRKAEG